MKRLQKSAFRCVPGLAALFLLSVLLSAQDAKTGMIRIDIKHPVKSFDPDIALGTSITFCLRESSTRFTPRRF